MIQRNNLQDWCPISEYKVSTTAGRCCRNWPQVHATSGCKGKSCKGFQLAQAEKPGMMGQKKKPISTELKKAVQARPRGRQCCNKRDLIQRIKDKIPSCIAYYYSLAYRKMGSQTLKGSNLTAINYCWSPYREWAPGEDLMPYIPSCPA